MPDNFENEYQIDVTGVGLRAYYMHPESYAHYVSFPVTTLLVEFSGGRDQRRRTRGGLSYSQMLRTGFSGAYSTAMPDGADELLERYGVGDFAEEYLIAIFRETDIDAKETFLGTLEPWDREETGVLLKHIGTAKPTKPFEYFYEPEK